MYDALTDMRWNMLSAPPGRLHAQMPLMALTYVNVIMRPPTSAGFLQGRKNSSSSHSSSVHQHQHHQHRLARQA